MNKNEVKKAKRGTRTTVLCIHCRALLSQTKMRIENPRGRGIFHPGKKMPSIQRETQNTG